MFALKFHAWEQLGTLIYREIRQFAVRRWRLLRRYKIKVLKGNFYSCILRG
jgi:hypothetical protein